MDKIKRVSVVVDRLKKEYPHVQTALNYFNAHELLFATMLSAQCTDKRVNIVTKELFKKYKEVDDYADADIDELKKIIRSTGFYNNKAKNIIAAAKKLRDDFGGEVPDNMDDLLMLPGVARKTASVVLHVYFNRSDALAVDTHVKRLSNRLGLTKNSDPVKIEKDLKELVNALEIGDLGLRLIEHGRRVCKARKPDCANCVLNGICPSAFKI